MTQPTTVLGFLNRQRDDQAVTAARSVLKEDGPRGVSLRATDELESSLDDAARAADRLDRMAISVRSEPMTYREDGPHSFFVDLASRLTGSQHGEKATMRLQRHRREWPPCWSAGRCCTAGPSRRPASRSAWSASGAT